MQATINKLKSQLDTVQTLIKMIGVGFPIDNVEESDLESLCEEWDIASEDGHICTEALDVVEEQLLRVLNVLDNEDE